MPPWPAQVILGVVHKHCPDFLPLNLGPPTYFSGRLPPHSCVLAAAAAAAAGPEAAGPEAADGAGGSRRRNGSWAEGESPCTAHWMGLERLFDSQVRHLASLGALPSRAALRCAASSP